MDALKYSCPVEVSPYEIDPYYKANILSINQMLDNGGMKHISHLGYSMLQLGQMGLGWALYQRNINIINDINYDEPYTIETIITGRQRIFTYRDYRIKDAKGNVCVESASVWILFDLNARSFVKDYPDDLKKIIDPGNQLDHLPRPSKIRVNENSSVSHSYTNKVRYSSLDFLSHLSNHHQCRMIYDVLPKSIYEKQRIKKFNTNFIGETTYGSDVTINAYSENENCYVIETTSQNKTLARAYIELEMK